MLTCGAFIFVTMGVVLLFIGLCINFEACFDELYDEFFHLLDEFDKKIMTIVQRKYVFIKSRKIFITAARHHIDSIKYIFAVNMKL